MDWKDYSNLSADQLRTFFNIVLDGIHDRVYVSDCNGKIILVNEAAVQDYNGELSHNDLIGKDLNDLVKNGYMEESLTIKVINNPHAQGLIYKEPEGHELLSWANPIMLDDQLDFVVSTEWDMENLDMMNSYLSTTKSSGYLESELKYYRKKAAATEEIVARSREMREVIETASMAARADATVLITGESGTGKEVVMRYIHKRSLRAEAPLIEVNCGAIPENLFESEFFGYVKGAFTGALESGKVGYFEIANGGTLFLDEIESLPLQDQNKLLHVIKEKKKIRIGSTVTVPLDVKIIAATNMDLEKLIQEGTFRKDLYYRLNVLPLTIPPLRKRKEDIVGFIEYFNKYYKL